MRKHYWTPLFIVMIIGLLIGCGGKMVQKASPSFEPYTFSANKYEPKVENFVVILDTSYSMNHKYGEKRKIEIAKEFLSAMNQTLPELNYNGALITFGHDDSIMLDYGLTQYSTSGFGSALNATKPPSGNSSFPLKAAITAAAGELKSSQGQIPVIIVSDGENMDQAPVKAAKALKGEFGDRLCIYTVLVGDNPAGEALMKQVAAAGECGGSASADGFKDSGAMGDFVKSVFLAKAAAPMVVAPKPMDSDGDGVTDDLDQCPNTPKGATVDARGCWTYAAKVMYDFDSAEIKGDNEVILQRIVERMKEFPDAFVRITGHTDTIGDESYNMKLSQRRAKAGKWKTEVVESG